MLSNNIIFRIANLDDAQGILDIYKPYITGTSLTFEAEVPTYEVFCKRIENYIYTWPWLVCEINNKIVGYAYANNYRERVCYQWSVECSVYIHEHYKQKGIGRALYSGLMQILKTQGYRNVYAVINLPNPTSVRFHEHFGFNWFATYDHVGYKLGEWKNVGWWKLQLNPYDLNPDPPINFSKLDISFLPGIFNKLEKQVIDQL